jgi:integrase
MRGHYASGSLRVHLATLKAALTIARKAGLIEHRADFPTLAPGPARRGFYSPAEASAHLAAIQDHDVGDLAMFLYLTGWRFNEGRQLAWTEVDRSAGVITLSPQRNKMRVGRVLPVVGEVAALVERRFKKRRLGCPWVFHRDGRLVTEYRFRADFAAALGRAQLGKKLPHDLRRSMARDQVRAGVSKPVAMANTGHSDARVFDRYDITAVQDQARRC